MSRNIFPAVAMVILFSFLAFPASSFSSNLAGWIKKGEEAYYKGKFRDAKAALTEALSQPGDEKLHATANITLGMVELATGNVDAAEARFRLAITQDPKRTLSKKKYPPNVVKLFNSVRAGLIGSVSVQTSPSDAQVFIDGQISGLTPVMVDDLVEGKREIKIIKEGYKIEEREMIVRAAERSEFYLELAVIDEIPAVIDHAPLASAVEGRSLRVQAQVTDNQGVSSVTLRFRKTGGVYKDIEMHQVKKGYYEGVIAHENVLPGTLEYYLAAVDFGENQSTFGNENEPLSIRVKELDREPPRIFHSSILATSDATNQKIKVMVKDNAQVASAKIFYKKEDDKSYLENSLVDPSKKGDQELLLPKELMEAEKIHYYIEATDSSGNTAYHGRKDAPIVVRVYRVLPFKEGYIVERKMDGDGDPTKIVTINVGSLKGYKEGQIFTVFNAKDQIIDPESGMVLAINQVLTGKIRITKAGPVSSTAKIIKEYKRGALAKGDLFRSRPGPPQSVGGRSEKYRQNIVSWDISAEPEVKGYVIYRSESPDGPFEEFAKKAKREEAEVVDKGKKKAKLVDGKKYFYKVVSYNAEKKFSDFSKVGFVVAKGGPNPPSRLAAASGQIRKVPLTWQRTEDKEASGYYIQRKESKDGKFATILTLESTGTSQWTDKENPKVGRKLIDAQPYWYRILSFNKHGKTGNPTEVVMASTRPKPEAPKGLKVVSTSVRSISLTWEMSPDPDVTRYHVWRHTAADGDYQKVKEIQDRGAIEYTDIDKKGESIKDGATYFYRLTAVNSGGAESELTEPVNGTTFGPPAPPAGFSAISGQVKSVSLSWTPSPDPETAGYSVYRGENQEGPLDLVKKIRSNIVTVFKDTGSWNKPLEDGKSYFYAVRSVNSVGVESVDNKIVEAITKPAPNPPAGVSATSGQAGSVTISWFPDGEADIQSYRVLRSEGSDKPFRTVAPKLQATSYNDSGLKNGVTYYYRVQAKGREGLISAESETVAVGTKPAPAKPEELVATASDTSVTLFWAPNSEPDIDHYIVYSTGFFGREKVGKVKGASFTVEKLKKGTAYTFVVTAVDKGGLTSEPSAPVGVTTTR